MSKKIRLGIIGLGAEGGMYAEFLTEGRVNNMEIGAICDILPEKKEAADEYGVPFYADYREMITSGDVDAVVTTVPHYLHPEMGIFALNNGVHALVEKPVGVYTKQANELIDLAATKPELQFGVFFNQRTNELYRDLKAIMRPASWATSGTPPGSSPPGGVRRVITPSLIGVPPGAVRAAASW